MTMVTEAKNALKNGTSTVISTVRRGTEAVERSLPINVQRPVKQAARLVEKPRTRVPVWPIVLAVGVAAVATAVVLVRRAVKATYAIDGDEFTGELSPSEQSDEEMVTIY
jgi:hypothetical protein